MSFRVGIESSFGFQLQQDNFCLKFSFSDGFLIFQFFWVNFLFDIFLF